MRHLPLDITELGEALKPVRRTFELDLEGLESNNRILVITLDGTPSEAEKAELKDTLESLGISAIAFQEEMLGGIRVLSRVEVDQVRLACEQMLAETQPDHLTPDEAKSQAARVIEALRMRPELYQAVLDELHDTVFRRD